MAIRQLSTKQVVNLASDPNSGTPGEIYYNTVNNSFKYYNGTSWVAFSSGGGGNSFETIDVPNGTDPVAESATDTLIFTESNGIIITGDSGADSIQFSTNATASNTASTIVARDANQAFDITAIDFDTTDTIASAVGRLTWDDGEGTLSFGLKGGNLNLEIGQENIALCYNGTGSEITKGSVVYISGAQGQRPSVSLADADTEATSSKTFGIVAENIANGAEGFVATFGVVPGLNTSGFTAGQPLWLSSTAGQLTNSMPVSPSHAVFIGYCLHVNESSGRIFVNPQNGYEIEELHDVYISSIADNHILSYDSATSLWKNQNLAAAIQEVDGTSSGIDADLLDGQHGSYYLDTSENAQTKSGDLTITGNLTVNGTTTTINSTTLSVDDKNIELGSVETPTDTTADGGGITLRGTTNKTFNWVDAIDAWTSSEHLNLISGKEFYINGSSVLSSNTLGSGITSSSLTSVGTITSGTWQGSEISTTYTAAKVTSVNGSTGAITGLATTSGKLSQFAATTSAELAGVIDDETGSGSLVFATSPTFSGTVVLPTSTTSGSSIRIPHGDTPTSLTDGDVWTTTGGMYVRVNGVTVGPLGAGGGGGGGGVTYDASAPASPSIGDLWVDSDETLLNLSVNDFATKASPSFNGAATFSDGTSIEGRITASSGIFYLQAGTSDADSSAVLTISRNATASTAISEFNVYADSSSFSGTISASSPTQNNHVATKQYVDSVAFNPLLLGGM